MERPKRKVVPLVQTLLILSLLLLTGATSTSASFVFQARQRQSPSTSNTPIEHIVIVMQENHAFDNLFGAFPGLDEAYSVLGPNVVCNPYQLSNPSNCVSPWNGDSMAATIQQQDLGHSWAKSHQALDGAKLDGFVSSQYASHGSTASYAMSFYTGATLPNYWDYASYFSLNANFQSGELSYSYPNHLYMVAASSGGCQQCRPSNNLTFPQIATELTQYGVSWRYYSGNWKDAKDCSPIKSGGVGYLNVLPDFPAVQLSPENCTNIKNLNDFYADINSGVLPNVAWVTPLASNSDHPGRAATLPSGQEYITNIVDAIESHPTLWASTVIFVTWDEYGGYSDHIVPTTADAFGYGFRVPLIVISPYATQGSIFYGPIYGQQEDFSAFLSTIEANWNVPSLTDRDSGESSLLYMLDFNQTPLAPLFLPTNQLATYPLSSCPQSLCNTTGIAGQLMLQPFNLDDEQDADD